MFSQCPTWPQIPQPWKATAPLSPTSHPVSDVQCYFLKPCFRKIALSDRKQHLDWWFFSHSVGSTPSTSTHRNEPIFFSSYMLVTLTTRHIYHSRSDGLESSFQYSMWEWNVLARLPSLLVGVGVCTFTSVRSCLWRSMPTLVLLFWHSPTCFEGSG